MPRWHDFLFPEKNLHSCAEFSFRAAISIVVRIGAICSFIQRSRLSAVTETRPSEPLERFTVSLRKTSTFCHYACPSPLLHGVTTSPHAILRGFRKNILLSCAFPFPSMPARCSHCWQLLTQRAIGSFKAR